MINYRDELTQSKITNKLHFDARRFFGMLAVWLVCAIFSFFPLLLRPMFTKVATAIDAGYWQMVMGDNDVLYLIVATTVIAIGIAVLFGKRRSLSVFFVAFIAVVGIFLAMMGYLMLEGDPTVFGDNVYTINTWALIADFALSIVLFISVSFRVKEGAEKK